MLLLAGASSHSALLAGAHGMHVSSAVVARSAYSPTMAFYPVSQTKPKTPLKSALKKRSGAHTVSVEVIPAEGGTPVASIDAGELAAGGGARRTTELTAPERLARVSAELRGGREQPVLAAAIWTSDIETLRTLANEQATAKGDFPGPCPVIFNGDSSDASSAVAAGAAGVVLSAADVEQAKALVADGVEIVWKVGSVEEVEAIVADEAVAEDSFLLAGDAAASLIAALPSGALAIGAVEAMQPDDAEVTQGRALVSAGCKSLLVRNACVGDTEDVVYSKYVVKQLTSKKSATFNIDGHTGAGLRRARPYKAHPRRHPCPCLSLPSLPCSPSVPSQTLSLDLSLDQ